MAIKNIGVLAFASAALAAHNHHAHLHARGTGSAPAIPTGLPECWGTCFAKSDAKGPEALCDCTEVTDCIKDTCEAADVASYEAWLAKQCDAGAPYPTGGHNSTIVGPTATGGYGSASSSAPYSTSICTETSTLIYKTTTQYSTYLITHTVYPSASSDVPISPVTDSAPAGGPGGYGPSSPAAPSSPGSPVGGGEDECSEVTVTTTERTTVTVTAGEGVPPSSYVPAPSSPAAPSSEEAPPAPSSYAPPPSSEAPPAPSSYAPPPSSYEVPSSTAASSSTKPSSPSQSTPPTYDSGFRGKRGIAYNDSSMIPEAMISSGKIGWASNWEGISKGFENSAITYIPTLHSGDSYWTGMWTEQAEAAIAQGLPYLFGPNEPDMPSQANLSPEACAQLWKTWMEPYAGRIKLVAPSVSSGKSAPGAAPIGLDWLKEFMGYCSDCTIDAVNQHWYNSEGNDYDDFTSTIDGAASYGKPVFVGEFAGIGDDAELSDFMGKVMSYMDGKDEVIGYAYFMTYEGLLVNGGALSPTGEMFCNGE